MPAACLAVFNLRFGTGSSGWASKLSLYFFPTPVVSYKTYSRSGIFICTPVGSESSSSSADGNTLTFSTKLRCQDRLAILDLISTDLRCYRDLVVSDIPLLLAFLVLTLFCHKHMSSVLLRDFLFAVKGAIASRVRARLQEFLLIRRVDFLLFLANGSQLIFIVFGCLILSGASLAVTTFMFKV